MHRILAAVLARPAHGETCVWGCLPHRRRLPLDDLQVLISGTRSSSLFSHHDQHQVLKGRGPLQEEGEQLQLEPRPSEIHQLDEAEAVKHKFVVDLAFGVVDDLAGQCCRRVGIACICNMAGELGISESN